MRSPGVVAAFALALLASGFVQAGPSLALPPDTLAPSLRAAEPTALPASGALDELANVSGSFGQTRTLGQAVSLGQDTTLRAVALARRSGTPLDVQDLSTFRHASTRNATASPALALDPGTVFAALLLGVSPTGGTLRDLASARVTFATTDATTQQVSLGDDDTLSGLGLLANGMAFDPRELLALNATASGESSTRALQNAQDPFLSQAVALSPRTALAAAPLFHADHAGSLSRLANLSARASDTGAVSREGHLPLDTTLGAIALHHEGIAGSASDIMTLRDDRIVMRVDMQAVQLDLGTVLAALLLVRPEA